MRGGGLCSRATRWGVDRALDPRDYGDPMAMASSDATMTKKKVRLSVRRECCSNNVTFSEFVDTSSRKTLDRSVEAPPNPNGANFYFYFYFWHLLLYCSFLFGGNHNFPD